MTCAHIVDVALKKMPGVQSVEVSLNKGLATVKLKPANTLAVPQFWQVLHQQGYTPKATTVTVRGELEGSPTHLQLKISGTTDVLDLAPDPKNAAPYAQASKEIGKSLVIEGVMIPGKDLKKFVPLQVGHTRNKGEK